jgi:hypothetical protein
MGHRRRVRSRPLAWPRRQIAGEVSATREQPGNGRRPSQPHKGTARRQPGAASPLLTVPTLPVSLSTS